MEKWQGQDAVDAGGKRAFIWEEDAWSNAAAQIKSAAPDASVVGWTDTMLVYTGWRLDGNASKPINHTLNPDANQYCATGEVWPHPFTWAHGVVNACVLTMLILLFASPPPHPRINVHTRFADPRSLQLELE